MEQNPYQTPAANVDAIDTGNIANAEAIRKEHLNHEASIRSIGMLYYLGAVGLLIATAVIAINTGPAAPQLSTVWLAFMAGMGVLYYWVAAGLRALQPKVRGVAAAIAALGLLSFPVGTLINGYILYLLLSAKGKMVFSAEYGDVIAATPHLKYKTSIIIWLLLGIVVAAIAAAIIIPMVNR